MSEIFIVTYSDWDDFRANSVWFDKELAQKRVDNLNAKENTGASYWEVDVIELGDPDNITKDQL